jgi:hypothetical protein
MRWLMIVVSLVCVASALGSWFGPRLAVATLSPFLAVAVATRCRRATSAAPDACIFVLLGAGSVAAVQLLYSVRRESYHDFVSVAACVATVAQFAIVPMLAGLLRAPPSRFATCVAAALCLSPAAHNQLDPFDYVPETIFLLMASFVSFVSAAWVAHFARSRSYRAAFGASPFVLVGGFGLWSRRG